MKNRRVRPTQRQLDRLLEDLRALPDTVAGDHLTADEAARYTMNMLEPHEFARVDRHLASCEPCLERLEHSMATTAAWQGEAGQRRMAEFRRRALAGPSLLERLRRALAALPGPRLAPEALFRTGQLKQTGESSDGLVRWSLRSDRREPKDLVFFLWSNESGLMGAQIRVTWGAWDRELTLERLPGQPETVGAEIKITQSEQSGIAERQTLEFALLEPTLPSDDEA